jgi:hypothetical protein
MLSAKNPTETDETSVLATRPRPEFLHVAAFPLVPAEAGTQAGFPLARE